MDTLDITVIIMITTSLTLLAIAVGGIIQYHYSSKQDFNNNRDRVDEYLYDLYHQVEYLQSSVESLNKKFSALNNSVEEIIEDMYDPEITAEIPIYEKRITEEQQE